MVGRHPDMVRLQPTQGGSGMKPGLAGVMAVAMLLACAVPGGASADGPLKLVRAAEVTGHVKTGKHRIRLDFDLSSPRGAVGTATFRCKFKSRTGPSRCLLESRFSEGVINARTRVRQGELFTYFPITGGSGAFRGATGKVLFGANRNTQIFVYKLERYG